MERYMAAMTAFSERSKEEQPEHMGKDSAECIDWIIDYIYAHNRDFKILICCSKGTPYEHFIDSMVEIEVDYTFRYIEALKSLGNEVPEIDHDFCHMITNGMFEGMFEVIRHDMPIDRAKAFIRQLHEFYTAGWLKMMGQ